MNPSLCIEIDPWQYVIWGWEIKETMNQWYSLNQLILLLEKNVTVENIKKIRVSLFEKNSFKGDYHFADDYSALIYEKNESLTIPTPKIQQIIKSQTVQKETDEPKFVLIKYNDATQMNYDCLLQEVSKMKLDEIKEISIYDVSHVALYKYLHHKNQFENKGGMALPKELTKHLAIFYKMLIVSAEDLDNPFKLTQKYICEKEIVKEDEGYEEMNKYRTAQLRSNGGDFEYENLFKGHLVRIYILKENVIIGEINNRGLYYKGSFKTVMGDKFIKCTKAMSKYDDHLSDFRSKPIEIVKNIFLEMAREFALFNIHIEDEINNHITNVDTLVNCMIKLNEFRMVLKMNATHSSS